MTARFRWVRWRRDPIMPDRPSPWFPGRCVAENIWDVFHGGLATTEASALEFGGWFDADGQHPQPQSWQVLADAVISKAAEESIAQRDALIARALLELKSLDEWAEWIVRPGVCGEPEWRNEVRGAHSNIKAAIAVLQNVDSSDAVDGGQAEEPKAGDVCITPDGRKVHDGASWTSIKDNLTVADAVAQGIPEHIARAQYGGPKRPEYEPKTPQQRLGYLVEECGEVMAAAGKAIRWGLDSSNPELPPERRETNAAWLLRELADLTVAIDRMRQVLDVPAERTEPQLSDDRWVWDAQHVIRTCSVCGYCDPECECEPGEAGAYARGLHKGAKITAQKHADELQQLHVSFGTEDPKRLPIEEFQAIEQELFAEGWRTADTHVKWRHYVHERGMRRRRERELAALRPTTWPGMTDMSVRLDDDKNIARVFQRDYDKVRDLSEELRTLASFADAVILERLRKNGWDPDKQTLSLMHLRATTPLDRRADLEADITTIMGFIEP
jgi:NTP pyrophosphatase (non-canonical NTP hydrolase)